MGNLTQQEAQQLIGGKLTRYFGVSAAEATREQVYKAVVMSVRDIMLEKRQQFHLKMKAARAKRVYYLCMEVFDGPLPSRTSVYNRAHPRCRRRGSSEEQYRLTLEELYEEEPDAGLGNGGLGRLAACFLDGLRDAELPRHGIFHPLSVRPLQAEDRGRAGRSSFPMCGSPAASAGSPSAATSSSPSSSTARSRSAGPITAWRPSTAMPRRSRLIAYDMMVSGADSQGGERAPPVAFPCEAGLQHEALFRRATTTKSCARDSEAELISKVLYPSDNHYEGKTLRLKQQYFPRFRVHPVHRLPTTSAATAPWRSCRTWRPSTSTIPIPRLAIPELIARPRRRKFLRVDHGYGTSRRQRALIPTTPSLSKRSKRGPKTSSRGGSLAFTTS